MKAKVKLKPKLKLKRLWVGCSQVSTIRDICNGEVSEILELSGAVVRIGAANGVPTPVRPDAPSPLLWTIVCIATT